MKLKNIFYKIILIVLAILVLYVTYCSIVNVCDTNLEFQYYNTIIIILGVIICIYVFKRVKELLNNISERKINIISIILCIAFWVALSIFGSQLTVIPSFDLSDLQVEVKTMLENGGKFVDEQDYFAMYKAQKPVTILIYIICKIGTFLGVNNLRIFTTIVNSAFISITAFFTYLSVKEAKDYKVAFISLLFFIINPAFYCYTSWFYTDSFSMPFAAIGIYLFLVAQKHSNNKKSLFAYLFSGLVLAIGFNIRVVVGIILIAIIMTILLNNKFNKNVMKNIFIIVLGFLIGIMLCKLIMMPFNKETDKNKEFPITHWIMMGLNTEAKASWNELDYYGSRARTTYEKKIQFNLQTIKERLNNFTLKEFIEFLKMKLDYTWAHGDYGYMYFLKNVEEINGIYEYIVGNKSIFFLYYCQIIKATMMSIFSIIIVKEIFSKEQDINNKQIYITLFGAFLFYLIWEANRRYSFSFLPILIMSFGDGISQLSNLNLNNMFKNKEKIKRILKKFKLVIPLVVITFSTVLIIKNYYYFTIDKGVYYDKSVVSETRNRMDTINFKVYDNEIEQTFKTDTKFNTVYITFVNKNFNSSHNYVLELYNSKNEKIDSYIFNSRYIGLGYEIDVGFYFRDVEPNGEEEFTLKIYSIDATNENSLYLFANARKGFSIYPDGQVRINGQEKEMNLIFRVGYVNYRSYVSKTFYMILSSAILGIQIFAFYPYFRKYKKEKEFCD